MNNTPLINHYLVVEGLVTKYCKSLLIFIFVFHSHILFISLVDMRRVTFLFDAHNIGVSVQLHCLGEPNPSTISVIHYFGFAAILVS